ncbi:MAG: hypothetical protein WKF65_05305 [Gaiellaceae bacterium]
MRKLAARREEVPHGSTEASDARVGLRARGRLVEKLERPLAQRTPFSADAIRAGFGALFLFWSVRRIVRALRAALER